MVIPHLYRESVDGKTGSRDHRSPCPMLPAVSVLFPYRNAAPTVGAALESLLAQVGVELEVLAMDDGSTDGGDEVVHAIAKKDGRVHCHRTSGLGIVGALEGARSRARAPWIARMDADDLSLPGRLARQVSALEEDPTLGALGTRVALFPERGLGEGLRLYAEWQNGLVTPEEHERDLFVESPLCHPSVMMRREALEAVGGYRETEWWEDYDLWLRMAGAGWRLAKIPEVLLKWRHSEGRMTLNHPRAAPARLVTAKAFYLAPRLVAMRRPVVIWGAGPTGKRLARALETRGVRAERFVDIDPRKIGRRARGAPIEDPGTLAAGRETIVVAVGSRGARALIRAHLDTMGFVDGVDYVCAA